MNEARTLSMLSLCMKAGKLTTGESSAEAALGGGTAELVIVAGDASDNTKKKFVNKCFYYKKPVVVYGNRHALSSSVGKHNRTVFVVTERNLAKRLMELMEVRADENT